MRKFIAKVLFKIVRIEHIIYCLTDCKVELPLHKSYYNYRREKYELYVLTVAKPKYDW